MGCSRRPQDNGPIPALGERQMTPDDLFPEIQWSTPVTVEELRVDRSRVPRLQGLYVFTNHNGPIEPGRGILYVGMTNRDAKGLYGRLYGYLRDPAEVSIVSSKDPNKIASGVRHSGKAQLLVEIQQKYRGTNLVSGVYVRWFACPSPDDREEALIRYLKPAFNTHYNQG